MDNRSHTSKKASESVSGCGVAKTSLSAMERCSVWVQQHQRGRNKPWKAQQRQPVAPDSDAVSLTDSEQVAVGSTTESVDVNKLKRAKITNGEVSFDEALSESTEVSYFRRKRPCDSPVVRQDDTEVETSVLSEESINPRCRKKEIRMQNLVWDLHCGWKDCDFTSGNLSDFFSHVSFHLPHLDVRLNNEEEEVYLCVWDSCGFETPDPDEVMRHVNFHAYHTKMKCIGQIICDELRLPPCTYGSDGANLVPDLPNLLSCCWDDCTLTSNDSNTFFNHVKYHAKGAPESESKNKVLCLWKGCKAEIRLRSKLEEHLRSHTQEKVAACPTCGSLFASRTKLVDHRKRQVPIELNSYQCSHCSRFYPSERLLRDHMRHHVNNYKCEFCDMTCSTPSSLIHHIRFRHIDEKPFACQYCSHRSKLQHDMKVHVQTHLEDAPFKCEEEDCTFSCRTIAGLNRHYRKAHEDENPPLYCCHMCDSRFQRGSLLTKHMIGKHNFRWPSGHSRFRYKHDEDGLYRLQTVRYESLEVAEDIHRGHGGLNSFLSSSKLFHVEERGSEDSGVAASFIIKEMTAEDAVDEPDEPVEVVDPLSLPAGAETTSYADGEGEPNLPPVESDSLLPPNIKRVLISIDEVDSSGNVIHCEMLEAVEVDAVNEIESGRVVSDGDCLDLWSNRPEDYRLTAL